MLNRASANAAYTKIILHEIAVLNTCRTASACQATPMPCVCHGARGYSNWELSADRANASRRELITGGMAEEKMLRVVGLASSVPFNQAGPHDPVNRRISIIVMNKRTEDAITKEASGVNVADEAGVREEVAGANAEN